MESSGLGLSFAQTLERGNALASRQTARPMKWAGWGGSLADTAHDIEPADVEVVLAAQIGFEGPHDLGIGSTDPNTVLVQLNVEDTERAQDWFRDDRFKAATERAGRVSREIYFANRK